MDDITGTKLVDGHDVDYVIDLLVENNTVPELREMAQELDVSRERGSNKRETAWQIAHEADYRLEVVKTPDGHAVRTNDWGQ